ncbi:MAG: hypothetical protein AAFO95_01945 [Cyanobacteria bacterium J06600_6]
MTKITTIEQYKNSSGYSIKPQISGKNVVWHSQQDNKDKIFFYDGNKTVEICSVEIDPELSPIRIQFLNISGDYAVWLGIDSDGKKQVFFYDGQEKIQITDNHSDSGSILFPQITENSIVWNSDVAYFFENIIYNSKIFLDNGKDIVELTNSERVAAPPKLSGDNIVWSGFDSQNKKQIFFYDGKKVIQLTKNNNFNNSSQVKTTIEKKTRQKEEFIQDNKRFSDRSDINIQITRTYNPIFGEDNTDKYKSISDDYNPLISGKNIVWEAEGNLFLYNGKKIVRLDDKNRDVNGYSVRISGDNVAWTAENPDSGREVFLYNGTETIQLTNNGTRNMSLGISGKNVVWQGVDSDGDSEIFLYNGRETIQLTNNDTVDKSPQISGDYIVWQSSFDLFAYNGSEVIHLAKRTGGRLLHLYPKIDGNKIVWEKHDLLDNTTSIMLATLNDSESLSIPTIDRAPQILTTSAIAIFSLILVYLCQKLIYKH